MAGADPVADLVQRWRAGDERAAEQLFARYGQRLVHLAEQHLSRRLAGRMDGEDVVQSVFRTFFRRTAGGEFRLDSSAQIWRLLVQITLRKTGAKARYHTAGPRNAAAEVPGDAWLPEALASDPGPAEATALVDQIAVLLRGLPVTYGSMLEMRLQGYDLREIAAHLDCSVRTVQRALTLLQQRLSRDTL
jgi:RNA polymerase sigma-70 factor (ECF subfamily)